MSLGELDSQNVKNFARPESWLGRGGQPDIEGYHWLFNQGFRVVVNLRIHDESRKIAKQEPNLQFIHIPVKNNLAPTEGQALQWLVVCEANQTTNPIFVHCKNGEGRTSTFCALARIAQGWSVDQAIAEQRPFGFDPRAEHRVQAQFLREFFRKSESSRLRIPRLA